MPLTTTATWPDLQSGKKAKASEVESKFDWIEGNLWPMNAGSLSSETYNLGSSSYKWKNIYVSSISSDGPVKIWGNFRGDDPNIEPKSYNAGDITRHTTGTYQITIAGYVYLSEASINITVQNTTSAIAFITSITTADMTDSSGVLRGNTIHSFHMETRNLSDVLIDPSKIHFQVTGR